ncbi:MAG: hypothetical protein K6F09_07455 [Clostridiales bacterium]|nr:hypothetical protein [Clostridiales bacterium]
MRILTEADLRASFQTDGLKEYTVPPDVFVTPSAREYLAVRGISLVVKSGQRTCFDETRQAKSSARMSFYIDAETGRTYDVKPEDMTHLRANVLVKKTHPVIALRGKIDTLEADIIIAQVKAEQLGMRHLVNDLQEALVFARELLAAEVKNEPLKEMTLLGLTLPELRRVSHDIKTELGLKQHPIPSYTMGEMAALVNKLRTSTREAELAAERAIPDRYDILTAFNRLSSCFHIIFCRLLTDYYKG